MPFDEGWNGAINAKFTRRLHQRHIAMNLCRALRSLFRCLSYQYVYTIVPHRGQNDFEIALNLEVSRSGRAHAQMTNVQRFKLQCKKHMEEISGAALYI